ncbi:unnamed protein product [Caenorhabditis sp. 36 PRJEB53466]|nr:unnamed protein product [Caenorhabditis sp. 36 PRJEB53466]
MEKAQYERVQFNLNQELIDYRDRVDDLYELTNKTSERTIEYERERIATERGLHAEAKRWLMQEVSERDNKVSSLRLELRNRHAVQSLLPIGFYRQRDDREDAGKLKDPGRHRDHSPEWSDRHVGSREDIGKPTADYCVQGETGQEELSGFWR